MFRSLQIFNYRVWFFGALLSNVGTWIQTTTISWYILTDLSGGNASAVGLAFTFQFAPNLLLLPLTGWISDRFERRRTIAITQTLLLLEVGTLGVLVLLNLVDLPLILFFAALYGITSAIDIPIRQSFVTDLVEGSNVSNAVALNSASFNLGRLLGPAAAGLVLITWGAGWAFLANSLSFVALLIAIVTIRRDELVPRPFTGVSPKIWGGFRYLRKRPDIVLVIVTMFLVSALGTNLPLITATMVNMFQGDAADFGFVNSIVAVGSLVGALIAARNRSARLPILFLSFGLMSAAAFAGAFAPNLLWYGVPLILSGFATILALATANGYVQSTSHPVLRGRVLAIYLATTMGASAFGAPLLGSVSDAFGARWTVILGGIGTLAAVVIGCIWLRRGQQAEPIDTAYEGPVSTVVPTPAPDMLDPEVPPLLADEEGEPDGQEKPHGCRD